MGIELKTKKKSTELTAPNIVLNAPVTSVNGLIGDVVIDIPSKVSELENDMDFAQVGEIPTKVSELENDKDFAQVGEIPIKVSDLENDAQYLSSIPDGSITANKIVAGLPADCTPLHYLEGDREQYIDLGFLPDRSIFIEIWARGKDDKLAEPVFGVAEGFNYSTNALTSAYAVYRNGVNQSLRAYIGDKLAQVGVGLGNVGLKMGFEVKEDNFIYSYCNDERTARTALPTSTVVGNGTNALLFGINTTEGAKGGAIKVFRFRAHKRNADGSLTLFMDLRPVLNSYCVPCMYDLISGAYFMNAGESAFYFG